MYNCQNRGLKEELGGKTIVTPSILVTINSYPCWTMPRLTNRHFVHIIGQDNSDIESVFVCEKETD